MEAKYRAEVIYRAAATGGSHRSNIYAEPKPSTAAREPLKLAIKSFLCATVFPGAASKVANGEPLAPGDVDAWIEALRERLAQDHAELLRNGELRYGNAQKYVNLYLKYMWTCGFGPEPPYFPVDRVIQKALPSRCRRPWTTMSKEGYDEVIAEAQKVAGGKSLAQWKLAAYAITGQG